MSRFESFHRGEKLGFVPKLLPSATYNEMILLFHGSGKSCLFVPIRSMQYMAVIDHEEVIFVDSQRRQLIEFTWRKFAPQTRNSLDDPVPYEFEYYDERALETVVRMQIEFSKFIHQMSVRAHEKIVHNSDENTIIDLSEKKSGPN